MTTEAKITEAELNQFTGTEKWHRHWMGLLYTDGVEHLAEKAKAYWLLDVIFSYKRKEPFQLWEIKLDGKGGCVVTMREDSDRKAKVTQKIPYTDFPLQELKLYLTGGVLLLPSEY